ncbi:MAG: DUF4038 domain-containing protein [Anaerolineae bacterium]
MNMIQWSVSEIALKAQDAHSWWSFPVQVTFSHAEDDAEIVVDGVWDGKDRWIVRFAMPLPGTWRWHTHSRDPGLDGRTGELDVLPAGSQQLSCNPNYHGHIGISANGRHFEHADGTPFFLLADTLWAGNTARCGLGDNQDGPFFAYLDDRESRGFTTILMQCMRGFGDTATETAGQRNEGGYPFHEDDLNRLNPAYFQALDTRMDALWLRGFAVATPITWWGKMKNCFFDLEWAKRIGAYLMARYGAYNLLWSLSGEYQYALRDCGWSVEGINELGEAVQMHNVYQHPVSIHPSGRTDWPEPHNVQSSGPFHSEGWLDHHWLQTGQSIDRMYNIVVRCRENRDLMPTRPVFCAESYYERQAEVDAEGGYHARWQAWTAFLSGAAGYGYGAFGVWQFYDPDDPDGETGKDVHNVVPWQEALAFEGVGYMRHVKSLMILYPWWNLEPHREWLRVNGALNPLPTADDLTPPHCAAIPNQLVIVYVPRGNEDQVIEVTHLDGNRYTAEWINPRDGNRIAIDSPVQDVDEWRLPERPQPATEDWVMVLSGAQSDLSMG